MTIPEKADEWAVSIARDDSHGYNQATDGNGSRWGPDYDCSSIVISAYKHAGLPLQSTYTGNMKADFLKNGFRDVTDKVNLATGAGMEPGDVLLNEKHHTALYIGNGQMVEATGNEMGGIVGGKPGDQTGREITINPYRNFGAGWDCVLRYVGDEPTEDEPDVPDTDVGDTYTVKRGDTLWGIAMMHDMSVYDLAKLNGISLNDYIYPGQVLKVKMPTDSAPEDGDIYIVKPGDSLWQIAQHKLGKGWKWYRIAEANNLSAPYIIHAGQRLKIPKGDM